jgi:hypothetical protein
MIMNRFIPILTLALTAVAPARALAQANLENDPAYLAIDKAIDLAAIRPEVNVNLPRFLLQDALSGLNGGPDDPFAAAGVNLAELVKDVKLIRLVVIEGNQTNRAALAKGVAALRQSLESKWTPIVTVPEDGVGIFALGDPSGATMAGLALLIHDDGEAVIANIVGRVSLANIVKLASRLDEFPKDLIKKLSKAGSGDAAAGAETGKREPKPAKSGN